MDVGGYFQREGLETNTSKMTFQELIIKLQQFWVDYGCLIGNPTSDEVGAGTFNPLTFLKVLEPGEWRVAYLEPSRRPTDGRYGDNPNRLFQHYQYQVVIKPSPSDIQKLYISSLSHLGIKVKNHDIRFLEDDWESPTLGAFGLGWEVRLDGMEITQFTYFQKVGGIELDSIPVELTYGLERLCMLIQGKDNVFDIQWAKGITYGDLHLDQEKQFSRYCFDEADIKLHTELFQRFEKEAVRLLKKGLIKPAYGFVLKCSHTFNILDARRSISSKQRQNYINRIRKLSEECATVYLDKVKIKK